MIPAVQDAAEFLTRIFDRHAMPGFADHFVAPGDFPQFDAERLMSAAGRERAQSVAS
jgi:hypothetical protein